MKNNKIIISLIIICLSIGVVKSQVKDTSYWKKGMEIGFSLSNSTFSPNWRGGGVNNFSTQAFLNGSATYLKSKISWDNKLNCIYGIIRTTQYDVNGKKYASRKKSLDNFIADSKFGYGLTKTINAYSGLTFQTQMTSGYNYLKNINGRDSNVRISNLLAPGSLVEAIGLEWKPYDWFFARVGGAAIRQTFVLDQKLYEISASNELYGVTKGGKIRNEIGIQIQAGLNKDLDKKKSMNIKANYLGFAPWGNKNSPLDSRIDLIYTAKLTKFITFNCTLIAIFDKDQREPGFNAWQNSQQLGIGLLFKI